jgi:hypothetical protein
MQNSLKPVSAGNIPDEVNVIIEIPAHSSPVKSHGHLNHPSRDYVIL